MIEFACVLEVACAFKSWFKLEDRNELIDRTTLLAVAVLDALAHEHFWLEGDFRTAGLSSLCQRLEGMATESNRKLCYLAL